MRQIKTRAELHAQKTVTQRKTVLFIALWLETEEVAYLQMRYTLADQTTERFVYAQKMHSHSSSCWVSDCEKIELGKLACIGVTDFYSLRNGVMRYLSVAIWTYHQSAEFAKGFFAFTMFVTKTEQDKQKLSEDSASDVHV